jgi:hypothetical protein
VGEAIGFLVRRNRSRQIDVAEPPGVPIESDSMNHLVGAPEELGQKEQVGAILHHTDPLLATEVAGPPGVRRI